MQEALDQQNNVTELTYAPPEHPSLLPLPTSTSEVCEGFCTPKLLKWISLSTSIYNLRVISNFIANKENSPNNTWESEAEKALGVVKTDVDSIETTQQQGETEQKAEEDQLAQEVEKKAEEDRLAQEATEKANADRLAQEAEQKAHKVLNLQAKINTVEDISRQ